MKYSEFEKRITERLGFHIENGKKNIGVFSHSNIFGYVSKEAEYNFAVRSDERLTHDEARFLAHQCHELACTPLDEREEEKKYRIRHKFIDKNCGYLNFRSIRPGWGFELYSPDDSPATKTIFTENELKELTEPVFYRTLLNTDIYEWEEVSE